MTVRGLQIDGYGVCLPEGTVTFGSATRYRAEAPAQHLDMLVDSAQKAIAAAGISADDLDCIIGATAVAAIAQFHVDVAVIGTSAIDQDGTLLDFDIREVQVSRAIIEHARTIVLVADSSKFARSAPVRRPL